MLIHYMNLNPEPFSLMKNHRKKIEMRLYDERRQCLQVGDTIIFTNRETKEQLKVEVLSLKTFPSFKELYEYYDKTLLGYLPDEEAHFEDMYQYYDNERINRFGALAIEIDYK